MSPWRNLDRFETHVGAHDRSAGPINPSLPTRVKGVGVVHPDRSAKFISYVNLDSVGTERDNVSLANLA
jgi:hypothetical protein